MPKTKPMKMAKPQCISGTSSNSSVDMTQTVIDMMMLYNFLNDENSYIVDVLLES